MSEFVIGGRAFDAELVDDLLVISDEAGERGRLFVGTLDPPEEPPVFVPDVPSESED